MSTRASSVALLLSKVYVRSAPIIAHSAKTARDIARERLAVLPTARMTSRENRSLACKIVALGSGGTRTPILVLFFGDQPPDDR
jgi:hypothetical protein